MRPFYFIALVALSVLASTHTVNAHETVGPTNIPRSYDATCPFPRAADATSRDQVVTFHRSNNSNQGFGIQLPNPNNPPRNGNSMVGTRVGGREAGTHRLTRRTLSDLFGDGLISVQRTGITGNSQVAQTVITIRPSRIDVGDYYVYIQSTSKHGENTQYIYLVQIRN